MTTHKLPGLSVSGKQKAVAYVVSILSSIAFVSSCSFTPTILKDPVHSLGHSLEQSEGESVFDLCFVKSEDGNLDLVKIKRKAGILRKNKLETAVRALLDGPTAEECASGLGSEIPRGTILLGMNEANGSIELNLSHRFSANGSGDSIQTRVEQIARTVKSIETKEPVYLNIEGQRLTMTPGEGLEVHQPINQ